MPSPTADLAARLAPHVAVLHSDPVARERVVAGLVAVADRHRDALAVREVPALTERTSYLITYGDAIRSPGEAPLATLRRMVDAVVGDAISDVHLLPMFPSTADDGFAVVDHRTIDPELGTWADVVSLGRGHGLMFDFVANHVSASSPWFRGWLAGNPRYGGYFIDRSPACDTSRVVRPRTSPLFHEFTRPDGERVDVWTTFGPDQVDVNVATPEVLLELTDVLLGYVAEGADTVRLDAIGYLWKESGTTSLHRPGTHAVIKIWRVLLDELAPGARLLTETNVPHPENISYFGDGTDEAHMVYQFALPPLVLHSFVAGDSTRLTRWAQQLVSPGPQATWFNFLASHDGIGMRPAAGWLDEREQAALADRALAHGGRVSCAREPDGSESVYELNVSYLDALVEPARAGDDQYVVARALAAHAILLSLAGVPAIYYHSLFGSRHDVAAVESSGISRRINRARLDSEELDAGLRTDARRRGIFEGITRMLRLRADLPAFDPFAPQQVLDLGPEVFAVRRGNAAAAVTVVANVSGQGVDVAVGPEGAGAVVDLLTGQRFSGTRVELPAERVVWLVPG